ncbi:hypothetical protein [Metabacillus halosaccharovorans]|uniref:hypothetical protein n=1 Tax=Metabacillus halosaccharovorans TaxID=930124 RepID=UPI00203FCA1C|nr:hypothetical protein [Metabacillus halosaccharovorans]MCM3444392.1 hypothetical protein [Metabacillus halosaccharovorans]
MGQQTQQRQPNKDLIIQSLTAQISDLSLSVASKEAVIFELYKKVQKLEQENKQLREKSSAKK